MLHLNSYTIITVERRMKENNGTINIHQFKRREREKVHVYLVNFQTYCFKAKLIIHSIKSIFFYIIHLDKYNEINNASRARITLNLFWSIEF